MVVFLSFCAGTAALLFCVVVVVVIWCSKYAMYMLHTTLSMSPPSLPSTKKTFEEMEEEAVIVGSTLASSADVCRKKWTSCILSGV